MIVISHIRRVQVSLSLLSPCANNQTESITRCWQRRLWRIKSKNNFFFNSFPLFSKWAQIKLETNIPQTWTDNGTQTQERSRAVRSMGPQSVGPLVRRPPPIAAHPMHNELRLHGFDGQHSPLRRRITRHAPHPPGNSRLHSSGSRALPQRRNTLCWLATSHESRCWVCF